MADLRKILDEATPGWWAGFARSTLTEINAIIGETK